MVTLTHNPRAIRGTYPQSLRDILNIDAAKETMCG